MKTKIEEMAKGMADMTKLQRCTGEMKMLQTEVTQIRDNCGEFLWCIDNWQYKIELGRKGINKIIYSNPFYSHRNGYRMRLRLEFGSDNLFLYLQILRCEFDSILQWPFRHEVEFELMNQETGRPHDSLTLNAAANTDDERWKKPTKEQNEGFLFYYVIMSYLSSNPALFKGNQITRTITKINP